MDAPLRIVAVLLGMQVVISDLYARRVANRWLLTALVAGALLLAYGWLSGTTGFPLGALLGLLLGLVVLLPFYAMHWMGAGDVKFFAVIGLLLGWQALLPIWIIASLLAGAHAVTVIAGRQVALLASSRLQFCVHDAHQRMSRRPWWQRWQDARQGRQGIPYAAYLGIGVFLTLLAMPPGGTDA